jgi:hypothetical protein
MVAWLAAGAAAATLCGPVLIPASQAFEPKTIAINDKTIKARMADLPSAWSRSRIQKNITAR